MSSTVENIEQLVTDAGNLLQTKMELLKLKTAAKASSAAASVLAFVVLSLFLLLALIVLSIGLAYFIGSKLDNLSYGFFIIGAVYLLVGLLIYLNRDSWIRKPLNQFMADKILN